MTQTLHRPLNRHPYSDTLNRTASNPLNDRHRANCNMKHKIHPQIMLKTLILADSAVSSRTTLHRSAFTACSCTLPRSFSLIWDPLSVRVTDQGPEGLQLRRPGHRRAAGPFHPRRLRSRPSSPGRRSCRCLPALPRSNVFRSHQQVGR